MALPRRDYVTFAEAGSDGSIAISEAEVATVPTVEATTRQADVLLLGGDTIVGGKQNRIINVTIWLGAASKTPIPVSCLEALGHRPGLRARPPGRPFHAIDGRRDGARQRGGGRPSTAGRPQQRRLPNQPGWRVAGDRPTAQPRRKLTIKQDATNRTGCFAVVVGLDQPRARRRG